MALEPLLVTADGGPSHELADKRRRFWIALVLTAPIVVLSGYAGILQADAYAGFNGLYASNRPAGAITEAACWAHARRKFFVLADISAKASGKLAVIAPLAFEAVKRINLIFDVV
jgi:transposase